ncbi:hypothetical protein, partial [Streptomyces sp. CC216C]|uniref:hypothetical protein n=1 Tax=Streptomyces sp. CC216C TaxID=3044576 RepID=UPI0024A9862B
VILLFWVGGLLFIFHWGGAPLPEAERGDVDRVEAAVRAALGDEVYTRESTSGTDDFPGRAGS